ncbi:MAG: tRNA (adenosine(37)-N6)-threonylcarbamoyltransferase complex dimerization subunit type 1 TsaB [Actinomycetota bacterium]
MNLLALETATTEAAAAILQDGNVVAAARVGPTRRHTEVLFGLITEVLEASNLQLRDVSVLACDVGPGLFTGLRVGVSTAQGLGLALGIDVASVTSLQALAASCSREGPRTALIDARRGEVFLQHFTGPAVAPVAMCPPMVVAPEDFGSHLEPNAIVLGDGAQRYAELLRDVHGITPLEAPVQPPVEAIGLLGWALASTGGAHSVETLRPLYLRDADATSNFTLRESLR